METPIFCFNKKALLCNRCFRGVALFRLGKPLLIPNKVVPRHVCEFITRSNDVSIESDNELFQHISSNLATKFEHQILKDNRWGIASLNSTKER